jgi:hypothetical protein
VSACQSSSAHVATVPSQIFLRVIKPGCAYGHKGKLCPSYARTASSRGEVSPCSAAFSLTHAQAGIACLRTAWWGLYCASASAYRLVIILSCNTLIGPRCSIRIRKEGEAVLVDPGTFPQSTCLAKSHGRSTLIIPLAKRRGGSYVFPSDIVVAVRRLVCTWETLRAHRINVEPDQKLFCVGWY